MTDTENRASFEAFPPADYGVRCPAHRKRLEGEVGGEPAVWKVLRKLSKCNPAVAANIDNVLGRTASRFLVLKIGYKQFTFTRGEE